MLDLVAIVVSIALVDSLNPSTVGPALYLATAKDARGGLARFTAGVFGVSLIGGLALALGPGELILSAVPHPSAAAKHSIELGLGVAALLFGLFGGISSPMVLPVRAICQSPHFPKRVPTTYGN